MAGGGLPDGTDIANERREEGYLLGCCSAVVLFFCRGHTRRTHNNSLATVKPARLASMDMQTGKLWARIQLPYFHVEAERESCVLLATNKAQPS